MSDTKLEPWQQRVVEEQAALTEKLVKLKVFLESGAFSSLDPITRHAMSAQYGAMVAYLFALDCRIALFK